MQLQANCHAIAAGYVVDNPAMLMAETKDLLVNGAFESTLPGIL